MTPEPRGGEMFSSGEGFQLISEEERVKLHSAISSLMNQWIRAMNISQQMLTSQSKDRKTAQASRRKKTNVMDAKLAKKTEPKGM